jgi:hypothetical protein
MPQLKLGRLLKQLLVTHRKLHARARAGLARRRRAGDGRWDSITLKAGGLAGRQACLI